MFVMNLNLSKSYDLSILERNFVSLCLKADGTVLYISKVEDRLVDECD